MRNSSENWSSALTLTQLSASSFSIGVAAQRSTSTQPASTFWPKERMIEASSSSLDPMTRYTVPVPRPAADAISLIVVTSYPLRPNSARATARRCAALSLGSASLSSAQDAMTSPAAANA